MAPRQMSPLLPHVSRCAVLGRLPPETVLSSVIGDVVGGGLPVS